MTYSQLMQTYMGVGPLASRPVTPNVAAGVAAFYYGTDTNSLYCWDGSAWHTITSGSPGTTPHLILDYAASTDVASGVSVPASTWTDLGANQSFTTTSSSSLVAVTVRGYAILGDMATSPAAACDNAARIIIDSAGTPLTKMLGAGRTNNPAYVNVLSGVDTIYLSAALSAGSHTVKVQVYAPQAATMHCLPGTYPNQYSLSIQVVEWY